MAIVTAASLEDDQRGFGFAAIWTLFLVIFLKILGQYDRTSYTSRIEKYSKEWAKFLIFSPK